MNEALKVFLIALGTAILLPFVVVALSALGSTGFALSGLLFLFVCFLVIYSDVFGEESEAAEMSDAGDGANPGDGEEST